VGGQGRHPLPSAGRSPRRPRAPGSARATSSSPRHGCPAAPALVAAPALRPRGRRGAHSGRVETACAAEGRRSAGSSPGGHRRGGASAQLGEPGSSSSPTRGCPSGTAEVSRVDPVAGRIPGAVNWPYPRPRTSQRSCSTPKIVVYCGSGVTACRPARAAGAGQPDALTGSWGDWCGRGLPAERASRSSSPSASRTPRSGGHARPIEPGRRARHGAPRVVSVPRSAIELVASGRSSAPAPARGRTATCADRGGIDGLDLQVESVVSCRGNRRGGVRWDDQSSGRRRRRSGG
jgi:hypothetical protein